MFFDDRRAQGHGGRGNGQSQRVVGVADRHGQFAGDALHGAQVHVAAFGRVVGGAVQYRQHVGQRFRESCALARGRNDFHRAPDFFHGRHAGGHDQRYALGGQKGQERLVGDFAGGHLDAFHAECQQEIGGRLVEGRGHELNAHLGAAREELAVQVFRHLQRLQHGVLVAVAGLPLLVFGFFSARRDQLVRRETLELDGIRAAARRRVDQLHGQSGIAVVVDAGFRNDEGFHGRGIYHAVHPPSTIRFCPVTHAERSLAK